MQKKEQLNDEVKYFFNKFLSFLRLANYLITSRAEVVIVADKTFIAPTSEVSFETGITTDAFMARLPSREHTEIERTTSPIDIKKAGAIKATTTQ